jgi:hypothetical protein
MQMFSMETLSRELVECLRRRWVHRRWSGMLRSRAFHGAAPPAMGPHPSVSVRAVWPGGALRRELSLRAAPLRAVPLRAVPLRAVPHRRVRQGVALQPSVLQRSALHPSVRQSPPRILAATLPAARWRAARSRALSPSAPRRALSSLAALSLAALSLAALSLAALSLAALPLAPTRAWPAPTAGGAFLYPPPARRCQAPSGGGPVRRLQLASRELRASWIAAGARCWRFGARVLPQPGSPRLQG